MNGFTQYSPTIMLICMLKVLVHVYSCQATITYVSPARGYKSLANKTTITQSISLTYLLRVKLQLTPTQQRHENRLYMIIFRQKAFFTFRIWRKDPVRLFLVKTLSKKPITTSVKIFQRVFFQKITFIRRKWIRIPT